MEALRRMILEKGKGIGNDIVKVDMFLNHRIDTALLFQMGEAWADEFRNEKPEPVLTVEASGIAMAVAAAHALGDIPVVFAKKSATVVQNDDIVQAPVYSFTHKTQNMIRIEKTQGSDFRQTVFCKTDTDLASARFCQAFMLMI